MLDNTTGTANTAIGHQALYENTTSDYNTAVGYQAGYSQTTAQQSTFVGEQAGYTNTTGLGNTFVGSDSGHLNTTGARNQFFGKNSGELITTGSYNSILGAYNGNQNNLDIRTSSNYVVLSDGQGNPVYIGVPSNAIQTGGWHSTEELLYNGAATGWDSSSSANTWTTITAVDFNNGVFNIDGGEKQIAAWLTTSKSGTKYMSLKLSEPYVPDAPKTEAKDIPVDDIPF